MQAAVVDASGPTTVVGTTPYPSPDENDPNVPVGMALASSLEVVSTAGGRLWLDVPYDEKDAAKALGAKWDPRVRRWYAPEAGSPKLSCWAALPDIPEILPGEDRAFGAGLFVDLVPSSCWFSNVRSCTTQRDWERLHRMIVGRAKRRCEACGRSEDRHVRRWLEAHERWAYDEEAGTQRLRRLLCLCDDCHRVTHYGLTSLQGMATEALAHLRAVTGMSEDQATAHIRDALRYGGAVRAGTGLWILGSSPTPASRLSAHLRQPNGQNSPARFSSRWHRPGSWKSRSRRR